MPRWPLAVPPLVLLAVTAALAVPPDAEKGAAPPANADAEQAADRAQVDPGLKVALWAAEPQLKNPVAFGFDERGRCYVVEANRFGGGVPDTRGHMYWLDEDIAAKTVDDRIAMYKKHNYGGSPNVKDRIVLLWDAAGKGKADSREVFAEGFNRPQDGLAAGVLARKGDVYFTCIPDLYRLKDTTGDGKADVTESLLTGFGVRAQFIGHDLHGLRMGPDGKLYFSIGDRGFTVTTKEGKTLSNPDSGAVLRCDPDGANLEVIHTGLRNPQELAFDDFGNLFTYENNSDSGDLARWVQIVEGGDSGWRCGYQYGTLMHHAGVPQGNRGPWNTEKIWAVPGPDGEPPAYVVPPLAHFGNGPAGLTHYPGVGLNGKYKDHFFACDFTASPANSQIWSLAVKPKGASFEVVDRKPFVKGVVPTDCEFGPDGALYWTDWVAGWDLPNKGRIFRLTDPEAMKNPLVEESRKLLAEGFEKKAVDELVKLLGHPHQQVRQEAQYELAARKPEESIPAFSKVAKESKDQLARLHAVWGLGMVTRRPHPDGRYQLSIAPILAQAAEHPELKVAVLNVVGGLPPAHSRSLFGVVRQCLTDPNPAVQAAAAITYGKIAPRQMVKPIPIGPARLPEIGLLAPKQAAEGDVYLPLFDLLKSNDNRDVIVRHAAVVGLTELPADYPLGPYASWQSVKGRYDSPAVRLGLVLALRRLHAQQLSEFLTDADPKIAVEAARAVYDERIEAALPKLAALADTPGLQEPVAYRALAANFYLGQPENAERLAKFAARSGEPDHLRVAALKLLADWAKPPRRDPITGLRMSLPDRPLADAAKPVAGVFRQLFGGSDALRKEAVQLVAKLDLQEVGPQMAALATNTAEKPDVRAEALFALEGLKAKELPDALAAAKSSTEPKLRAAAVVLSARANPDAAGTELPAVLLRDGASVAEKQAALAALGAMKESKEADEALAGWLDKYLAGEVPPELKLDLIEAAQARATTRRITLHAPLREKLRAVDRAARDGESSDPLSRNREVLAGGDADRGRWTFLNNAAVYCQRCHKLDGQGGEVGPPLNGIAAKHSREYLLASILTPSKDIAQGYQSVILELADGRTVSGVLRSKTDKEYVLVQGDGKVVTAPRDDVDAEKPDKSAMPDDLHKKLTKRELRDVVEFLATLKDEPKR